MKTHSLIYSTSFAFLLIFQLSISLLSAQVYNQAIRPDYVRGDGRVFLTAYDSGLDRVVFAATFLDSLNWQGATFNNFTEGFYVGSLDNSGNVEILFQVVSRRFATMNFYPTLLEIDERSDIHLAGYFTGPDRIAYPIEWGDTTIMAGQNTSLPNSFGTTFVSKLSSNGRRIRSRFWQAGYFRFRSIVRDTEGNYVCYTNKQTAEALGYPVDPSFNLKPSLVKLDSLGNYLWGRTIKDLNPSETIKGSGLAVDNDNNLYIGLTADPGVKFYDVEGVFSDSIVLPPSAQTNGYASLLKFKPDGSLTLLRHAYSNFGQQGAQSADITTDEDNNVYWLGNYQGTGFNLSGFYNNNPINGKSCFIAKYDSIGVLDWVEYADTSDFVNNIIGTGIYYVEGGNLYISGAYSNSPILGSFPFPTPPVLGRHSFIAKYLPNQTIAWLSLNPVPGFNPTLNSILPSGVVFSPGLVFRDTYFDSLLVLGTAGYDVPVITSFIDTSFNFTTSNPNTIQGRIFADEDNDCIQGTTEKGLANWFVRADPGQYYAITDSTGKYDFELDSGQYTLTATPPPGSLLRGNTSCSNPLPLNLSTGGEQLDGVDIGFTDIDTCLRMSLGVSSNVRRYCFSATTAITYCNTGISDAPSAPLYVKLPEHVTLISADDTFLWDADSNLVFQTELLAPGECRTISLRDKVNCGDISIAGLTQCTRVWMDVPVTCGTNNPSWSLASLEIEKECLQGDTILFVVENTGQGDMLDSTEYRVFKDTVLIKQANLLLLQNEQFQLTIPSNGQAYRLEIDQVANHPGNPVISDWIGNCIPTNTASFSANIAPYFPNPEPQSTFLEAVDCLPITGSFDPNDKQVKPLGVTAQNFVKPGRELDYKIRFQNTGTDTAFTVILVDTLSEHLDPASFQALGSSHPYSVRMEGVGKIRLIITYNDILLPDSTRDLAGSQGFFSFSISPRDSLADSIEVENFADIYFDYNPPVRTNTVRITYYDFSYTDFPAGDSIRSRYTNTTSLSPLFDARELVIWPNPTSGSFQVEFQEWPKGNYPMILYDKMGTEIYRDKARIVQSRQMLKLDINRHIPAGLYFLRIGDSYTEKVVIVNR